MVFFLNFRCDYYNCNENLPVLKRGRMEYTVHKLVSTLLGSFDEGKVCSAQPVSVEHNCSFLVDLKCVADPNDLRADDCGMWKHQGVQKNWMVVDGKGAFFSRIENVRPDSKLYLGNAACTSLPESTMSFKHLMISSA